MLELDSPSTDAVSATGDAPPTGSEGEGRRVGALTREAEGLRQSARQRAVVERATWILTQRCGLTREAAAARLRALAVESGRSLVAAAAELLGVRPPPAQPVVRGTLVRPAFPDLDDAARLVALVARPLGVTAVVLFLVAPDGALRLLGSTGVPQRDVRPWATIPPELDVPLTRAVTTGAPVILGSLREQYRLFPLMSGVRSPADATASLPVVGPAGVFAVIGLVWETEQDFDEAARERMAELTRICEPGLWAMHQEEDVDLETVGRVLGGLEDAWLLLHPVPDAPGGADAQVLAVDPRIPSGRALVGCRLTEIWPEALRSRVGDALDVAYRYAGVSRLVVPADEARDLPQAQGPTPVELLRIGAEVVLVWRRG